MIGLVARCSIFNNHFLSFCLASQILLLLIDSINLRHPFKGILSPEPVAPHVCRIVRAHRERLWQQSLLHLLHYCNDVWKYPQFAICRLFCFSLKDQTKPKHLIKDSEAICTKFKFHCEKASASVQIYCGKSCWLHPPPNTDMLVPTISIFTLSPGEA